MNIDLLIPGWASGLAPQRYNDAPDNYEITDDPRRGLEILSVFDSKYSELAFESVLINAGVPYDKHIGSDLECGPVQTCVRLIKGQPTHITRSDETLATHFRTLLHAYQSHGDEALLAAFRTIYRSDDNVSAKVEPIDSIAARSPTQATRAAIDALLTENAPA